MKISNAVNTNYSNPKPQNFGMKLDFDKAAVRMLGEKQYNSLAQSVKPWIVNEAKELTIIGKGAKNKIILKIVGTNEKRKVTQRKNSSVDLWSLLLATLKRINNACVLVHGNG